VIQHNPDFRLPVREASARLAEVVAQVTGDPGRAVVVSPGAAERPAVIVDAEHYRLAVAKAESLDRLNGRPVPHGGLVVPLVDDVEIEAGIAARRTEQTRLAAAKLANLR
jgi:prevent-host-death family protein